MELTPEEKQRIYLEEKARLEAQDQLQAEKVKIQAYNYAVAKQKQAEANAKTNRNSCLGCLAGIGLLFFIGFIIYSTSDHSSKPSSSEPAITTSTLAVGGEGYLSNGSANVAVAVDEQSFDDFTNAAVANDKVGMERLMIAGRIFIVPDRTKVKLLDVGFAKRHIRIEGGAHDTQDGWVDTEFLKP